LIHFYKRYDVKDTDIMNTDNDPRPVHWFWNERVWLPPNVSWVDVEPGKSDINYTKFSDLWYPLPAACVMILLRFLVEKRIFLPLGKMLGIKASQHKKPPTNEVLEAEFQRLKSSRGQNGKYQGPSYAPLSASLGMSDRQIDFWLKKRKLQDKPSTMEKFSETGWRAVYYTFAFLFGIVTLWDKSWLWDIKVCWYGYPHHSVDDGVWYYYMLELAFYWSLFFSQFRDVKRKDFWEMFLHHVTTIALLTFSWTCNLTRCGSLVLVIHDCADIFLELAKLCHYSKYNNLCDVIYAIFVLVWILTRLGFFPTWVLYSSTIEAPQLVEMFPAYYIFNGLLSVLLVLHVIWTYFILKIGYKALANQVEELKDSRSDSDSDTLSSSIEEEEEKPVAKSDLKKDNGEVLDCCNDSKPSDKSH